MTPAPLWRRSIAALIDFISVPAASFFIMLVTSAMATAEAYAGYQPYLRPLLLGVAGYLVLNGWLLYRGGQTLGKALMGICIVNAGSSTPPPLWKLIFIRALFFPLLFLPLGFSFVGFWAALPLVDLAFAINRQRRCLHDYAAGTEVILKPRS